VGLSSVSTANVGLAVEISSCVAQHQNRCSTVGPIFWMFINRLMWLNDNFGA